MFTKKSTEFQVKDWEELHHMANTLAKVNFFIIFGKVDLFLHKIKLKLICKLSVFCDVLLP